MEILAFDFCNLEILIGCLVSPFYNVIRYIGRPFYNAIRYIGIYFALFKLDVPKLSDIATIIPGFKFRARRGFI